MRKRTPKQMKLEKQAGVSSDKIDLKPKPIRRDKGGHITRFNLPSRYYSSKHIYQTLRYFIKQPLLNEKLQINPTQYQWEASVMLSHLQQVIQTKKNPRGTGVK